MVSGSQPLRDEAEETSRDRAEEMMIADLWMLRCKK